MKQLDITPPVPANARRTAGEASPGSPAAGEARPGAALEGAVPVVAPAVKAKTEAPAGEYMPISQKSEGDVGSAFPSARTPRDTGRDRGGTRTEDAEDGGDALLAAAHPDLRRAPLRFVPDDALPRRMKRDGARDPAPAGGTSLDADQAEPASRCDIQGAIPFDVPDRQHRDVRRSSRRVMLTRSPEVEIDDPPQAGADAPEQTNPIAGIDDRTFYLAMTAAPGTATLRPPRLVKAPGVSKVRAKPRAQCERRCGGACDGLSCPGCAGVDGNRLPDAV